MSDSARAPGISVVVPVFNEEESLRELLAELEPVAREIDSDYEIVKKKREYGVPGIRIELGPNYYSHSSPHYSYGYHSSYGYARPYSYHHSSSGSYGYYPHSYYGHSYGRRHHSHHRRRH